MDGDKDSDGDHLSNLASFGFTTPIRRLRLLWVEASWTANTLLAQRPANPIRACGLAPLGRRRHASLTMSQTTSSDSLTSTLPLISRSLGRLRGWNPRPNRLPRTYSTGNGFFRAASNADADSDGLTDGYEAITSRTTINSPDSDGDGWPTNLKSNSQKPRRPTPSYIWFSSPQ